ncbi:MAG TPA: hypothetical protein VF710_21490 [Longimicrobium sp.]
MMRRTCTLLALLLPLAAHPARAQEEEAEVTGFLVEEAYNQEAGHLQQIAHWTRTRGGAWEGVYGHEWPLGGERHQLDLSIPLVHTADGAQGIGDVEVGYRFGLLGGSGKPFTLSPGISLTLPTGDESRGGGETEAELLLPASLRLADGRLFLHTNVNAAVPLEGGSPVGFTVGESAMWRPIPRLTLLMDAVYGSEETPLAIAGGEDKGWVLSPGLQYAFDIGGDAQLVPGIAFPFDPATHGPRGVYLYLTADHPFRR